MTYIERVWSIFREYRFMLVYNWGKAPAINHKNDSTWSIVTGVDIEVEKRMSAALAEIFPDVAFVGEESGGDRNAEKFWLMDPIDGTMHYSRGMPFCTSMSALIDKGIPIFSAIYDFLNDRIYYAEKGYGSYCNDEPIRVSERTLKNAIVSFETNVTIPTNEETHKRLSARTSVFKSYSAGFEFAMIASGKLEGRICLDPYGQDYDFAPGTLLVSEAGGFVANIGHKTYDYRNLNFIAANPNVFDELTEGRDALFPLKQ